MSGNGSGEWAEETEEVIRKTKYSKSPGLGDAWPDPMKSHSEEVAVARKRRDGRGERLAENQELGESPALHQPGAQYIIHN